MTEINLLVVVGAILFGVYVFITQRKMDKLEDALDKMQERQNMEYMEQRFQHADARIQNLTLAVLSGGRALAPMTPTQWDDRLVDVLADITEPGAPDPKRLQSVQREDIASAIDDAAFKAGG